MYEKFKCALCQNSRGTHQRLTEISPSFLSPSNRPATRIQGQASCHQPRGIWPGDKPLNLSVSLCSHLWSGHGNNSACLTTEECGRYADVLRSFQISRDWKEPKCPLIEGWLNHLRITHINAMLLKKSNEETYILNGKYSSFRVK